MTNATTSAARTPRFLDDLDERPRRSNVVTVHSPANVRRRVVIADDAPAIRLLFRRILEASSSFEVVGEAADGGEAVRLADVEQPDLVLLDLAMPVLDGLEAIPEVRRCSPETRIVVLSGFDAARMENEALACGADAYIEKRLRPDRLLEAVLEACEGPRRDWVELAERAEEPSPEGDLWLKLAIDAAPIGIALGGLNGRFHAVNDAFCSLLGYSRHELLERTYAQVSDRSDMEAEAVLQEQLFAGSLTSYQVQHRFLHANGSVVWTLLTRAVLPSSAGLAPEVITQVVDQTELNRLEARLLRSDAAMNRYEADVVRTRADLAEFATGAARELKVPLQLIAGFTSLLKSALGDTLDEPSQEAIDWILASVHDLDSIISHLLMYSLVGTTEPELAVVDLEDVMLAARTDLEPTIRATNATVTWDALPEVTGDVAMLTTVLRQLISNSLKFVDPKVAPAVHVGVYRSAGGWCIEVNDNGIGIPPEQSDRVFEVFSRLHGRDAYPGSGIGLAVCKRIVERAGGTISVTPNAVGGSSFRFTIPHQGPVDPLVKR